MVVVVVGAHFRINTKFIRKFAIGLDDIELNICKNQIFQLSLFEFLCCSAFLDSIDFSFDYPNLHLRVSVYYYVVYTDWD